VFKSNVRKKTLRVPGPFSFLKSAAALLLLGLSGQIHSTHITQYYAEPFTGKKVEAYSITLPLTRSEKMEFRIPADCNKVMRAFVAGSGQWGNQVERQLWVKVSHDCHYYAFLHRYPSKPENDFVSGYDFMNAAFSDLPTRPACDGPAALANPMACAPFPPGVPDIVGFLPFVDRPDPTAPGRDSRACYFKDGIFRGRLINDPSGVRCQADPKAPGFRLLSVSFADVNGDGFQDAVLHLTPLGLGMGWLPMILPLTRTEPDGPFVVPQNVVVPAPARGQGSLLK